VTVADIHRLLCTHCTFGTSELETHSADNASKVLGYSVRKSSLPDSERGQLRQVFRAVERLLSYSLPRDATAAQRETLSADLAPRRLIFMPNLGGWQVAGQVAYRAHDTAGRPGSYFADLLVAKAPDPRNRDAAAPWSAKDVLQLWSVGHDRKPQAKPDWWVSSEEQLTLLEAEENARNPESEACWKPAAPERIDGIRDSRPALLDDATVFRFLTAQTGDDGTSTDPFIPPRWWAVPTAVRQELVAAVLHATLLGPARGGRETVTLAVEPSVAAVVFYAVCRLLPGRVSGSLSFSTYEPAPDRPLTGLVATTCLDEAADSADLPSDLIHRAFACDTFRDPTQFGRGQAPSEHSYARHVVGLAVANDWQALDCFLTTLDLDGVTAADLDRLLDIERIVTAYLHGSGPGGDARRTPLETQFLRRRFQAGIEARLETQEPWPDDLLGVALAWFGDDFEQLWRQSESIRHLLARYLPRDTKGLARMLASSGKGPRVPMCVRAAAVIAAMKADPQYLPDAFIDYCKDAYRSSASSARPEATLLVRTVLSELPDLTVVQQARCFELTDLILEGLHKTPDLPQHLPVTDLLIDSLGNKNKSLQSKADLLDRHHALAERILPSDGRLEHVLSQVFADLLNAQAQDPGRHLVEGRRSRMQHLRPWMPSGSPARHRDSELLKRFDNWQKLHREIEKLAADAPPWRKWPRVKRPGSAATKPAVDLIEGLSALDPGDLRRSLERQRTIERGVVASLIADENTQKTVRDWLDSALDDQAHAWGPAVRGPRRRSRAWGRRIKIGAAILCVGMAAAAVGRLALTFVSGDELWRTVAGLILPEPEPIRSASPPGAPPASPVLQAVISPDVPQATPMAAEQPAAPPPSGGSPSRPPLSAQDIGLTVKLVGGNLVVGWAHEMLSEREVDSTSLVFEWKTPQQQQFTPISGVGATSPETPGQKTIDPKAQGFGRYEVKLTVSLEPPVSATEVYEIKEPDLGLSPVRLSPSQGPPILEVSLEHPVNTGVYGPVDYFCVAKCGGSPEMNRIPGVLTGKTLRFTLPEQFTPQSLRDGGLCPEVGFSTMHGETNLPAAPVGLPDASAIVESIRKSLERAGFMVADFPAVPPTGPGSIRICALPGLMDETLFAISLMTPNMIRSSGGKELQFDDTLILKRVEGSTPRWRCEFTPSGSSTGNNSVPTAIGTFELPGFGGDGWDQSLCFVLSPQPADAQAAQHCDQGFRRLRTCRVCLFYNEEPVATCQLLRTATVGPLKIAFTMDQSVDRFDKRSATLRHDIKDAAFLPLPDMIGVAKEGEPKLGWELHDLDGNRADNAGATVITVASEWNKQSGGWQNLLTMSSGGDAGTPRVKCTAVVKIEKPHSVVFEPPRWTEDISYPEQKGMKTTPWVLTDTTKRSLEFFEGRLEHAQLNLKLAKKDRPEHPQPTAALNEAERMVAIAETDLRDANARNALVEKLTPSLILQQWEMRWETKSTQSSGVPVTVNNDEIAGGTAVVAIKGSPDGEPWVLKKQ
jgi:hypothetical protein